MRRIAPFAAAALAAVAAPARGDIIDASSTTMVLAGQQPHDGTANQKPGLNTVVPGYEILTLSAREIQNPVAENLQIVLSTWGSIDFADRRWDSGTSGSATGDVMTGYVKGQFLSRALTLSVGREYVAQGAAHMIQLDGANAVLAVPGGVGISAYVGSPVSQRFQSRTGLRSWNPAGGDLAYGGRLSFSLPVAGTPGRGLDVGVAYAMITDKGDTARQDVGVDFRIQPLGSLSLSGFGTYSLYAEELAEANALLTWSPVHRLGITLDWRYFTPRLLLPQTSVLAVFVSSARNDLGAGVSYELAHGVTVGADGRVLMERKAEEESATYYGAEAVLRAAWTRRTSSAGLELSYLDSEENGYYAARVFGRKDFGPAFLAADVMGHLVRDKVNEQKSAVTGTLSAGYALGRGWSAVVSGSAGVTPFMEQQYDVMAKLVYNQTYHVREVR